MGESRLAKSVMMEFARFLRDHSYTTSMWDSGYTAADSNGVCHELTKWFQQTWGQAGEFLMLWSSVNDTQFSGDSELVYLVDGRAHLIPNPFIEGDAEGFVLALAAIVEGHDNTLYSVQIKQRILYNAV